MTDQLVTYTARITLDIVVPEGVTEWRFTTTADGETLVVSVPVAMVEYPAASKAEPLA